METKVSLLSKDIGDADYEGFELKSILLLLWKKISGNKEATISEKVEKVCTFFYLYTGKVEINIPDQEKPTLHYFPIRPVGTFLRSNLRDQYLENIPCVPAALRMKDLLIDSGPTLASKMLSGHYLHTKTNFPILSEIFRWNRIWLAFLVIISIVLNIFVGLSYSDVRTIDTLIGYRGESNLILNIFLAIDTWYIVFLSLALVFSTFAVVPMFLIRILGILCSHKEVLYLK